VLACEPAIPVLVLENRDADAGIGWSRGIRIAPPRSTRICLQRCRAYAKPREDLMEELDIKHQFHLLQKEVEATVSLTEEVKLNLLAAIDSLKIEVEVLKRFMERYHADFPRRYPELKEEMMREVDPEWIEHSERSDRAGRTKRA
jgi:hypothetical protein